MKIPLSFRIKCWSESLYEKLPFMIIRRDTWNWYIEMQHTFGCVVDHASGGRISKTNYTKEVYYDEITAAMDRHYKYGYDDALEDHDVQLEEEDDET